jgi:hypothetical protein
VSEIRNAPIEPGMHVPPISIVAPPPISAPNGPIAPKFEGGDMKSAGLAKAYEQASIELGCHFFNAATVTTSSNVDGVHLDTEQHLKLGQAIDRTVEAAF